MGNSEEKIAVHSSEIEDIRSDIHSIRSAQAEILSRFHTHELDSVKYKGLIDELIAEKKTKRESREALTDKLLHSGIWLTILFLLGLAWTGFKAKVGG